MVRMSFRQIDPLSLFVIGLHYLCRVLSHSPSNFVLHKDDKFFKINIIYIYVNDHFLLSYVNRDTIRWIIIMLNVFLNIFGLAINLNKSEALFSDVDAYLKKNILNIWILRKAHFLLDILKFHIFLLD